MKKTFQKRSAFLLGDPADRFRFVIKPMIGEIDLRPAAAAHRIERTENKTGETQMDHRSGAHGTRLERNVQRAIFQCTELRIRILQRKHLRVRERIIFIITGVMRF